MTSATRRTVVGGLILLYALAWAIGGALWASPPNDLDYYLLPASQIALHGHPLLIYDVRVQGFSPNDNGPVSLVPLTAVAALASWLGWLDNERLLRAIVVAAFSIFSLLMAREAVMAIDRLRGSRLSGRARVSSYAVFAASPALWQGVLGYGHVDVPITIWLILYSIRCLAADQPAKAGFGLGVALLTRSIAGLQLIPLGLLLLARHRWRSAAWLSGTAALTVSLGFLPFVLADRSNALYSLLTNRADVFMVQSLLWQPAKGTPYEWIVQRNDLLFIVAAATILTIIVIRGRKDLTPASADLYGLLALSALTVPLLTKSVWPYYFVDAFVFAAIWCLGQPGSLIERRRWLGAVVSVTTVVAALILDVGNGKLGPTPLLLESAGVAAALLVLMILLTVRLRRVPLGQGLAAMRGSSSTILYQSDGQGSAPALAGQGHNRAAEIG